MCLVPEIHATIFEKLTGKMAVDAAQINWRLLRRMNACSDEFQQNTSQANYFEGFWG